MNQNPENRSRREIQRGNGLVLMPVENAQARLLAGLEHVFQSGGDAESGRFVHDEERWSPGEGFVGGLYAQTKSAICDGGQIDSASHKCDCQEAEVLFQITIADIRKTEVGASDEFEEGRQNHD